MKHSTKIFCIGPNKTGTVSLHNAFIILGFSSVHFISKEGNIKRIIECNLKNNNKLLEGIENYDAYLDWNSPLTNLYYKDLDKQYPNSKFILNTRDIESWLISREEHVRRTPNLVDLREKSHDTACSTWFSIDINAWRKEYEELHDDIAEYFRNRKKDCLYFNVTAGDGWEKLCPFLGVDIPNEKFPYLNQKSAYTTHSNAQR